jgi:capsular polysaccharide transport system ATP-binding protein
MLTLSGVCKDYHSELTHKYRRVVDDVSFTLRHGEKIGVIGHNGAGKSTLIRLIAGVEMPTRGRIERGMSVSWPVGLDGGFAPSLTGNDNIRFISRIYNKPMDQVRDFVDDFAELGKFLYEPVRTYSSGMRARLNFGLSLAVDFDCYLIDEVIAVGDQRFVRRSHEELFDKRADRSLILASHSPELIRSYCSKALLLYRGRAKMFDDLDLALDIYDELY